MANDREAGALLFKQLETFVSSAAYFENVLSPSFCRGVGLCVEAFTEDNDGWEGSFDFAEDGSCWIAPENWKIGGEEGKSIFQAKFHIDYDKGDDDYWEALFCDVATSGGQAGFMFYVDDYKQYGGKNAWKSCIKNNPDVVAKIVALGFKNMNNGSFFLPIRLDAEELAKTWGESGGFEKDDDCFLPARHAMEVISNSVTHFDKLMQGCKK